MRLVDRARADDHRRDAGQGKQAGFGTKGKLAVVGWGSTFGPINRAVHNYLALKTLVSVLQGFLSFAVLAAFGIEFAGMWGVFIFLFNFVPYIGSFVAVSLPMRDDTVTDGGDAEGILANAPSSRNGFFVVPKVVE